MCPQGTPLLWFNRNEGHNNGRYGLRIFTGLSPHNGEGQPGFYPKKEQPCKPVSATNTFVRAYFQKQFSWRNQRNGISFGSVAAMNIVDAVVADNVQRGVEGTGADGEATGFDSITKVRGKWGENKISNTLFIAHSLEGCPSCDHDWRPV